MTKLRAPDTIEEAVHQAIAVLPGGAEFIASMLSSPTGQKVSASLVTKWADPEAPQRISLGQSLALEALLLAAGHPPVFGELFRRLKFGVEPGNPAAALTTAMQSTESSADLMRAIREALQDGEFQPHEVAACKARLTALQKELGALNRSLVVKRK
jgi:hypothetical protein